MFKKLASLTLVATLICAFWATSTFAAPSNDVEKIKPSETSSAPRTSDKEGKANEKLRSDVLKVVSDAKAGKLAPAARPQMQPPQSNNLSKKAKIAIGVGIAVTIIAIIVVVHTRNHLLDGL